MFPELHVSVATSRDVEIALHLVQVQAAEYAAGIGIRAPQPRRLGPLGPLPTEPHNVMDVFLAETLVVAVDRHPALPGDDAALLIAVQAVDALVVDPVTPGGRLALEAVRGKDSVAGGVLDVDMQIGALHLHHHVHVDLQIVADAFLDGKGVRLGATPPPRQLGPDEDQRHDDHRDCPFAAARGARYVLGFGFC